MSPEETTLEIIWQKFEEFCKPQTNEIRARFDLLTSFRQGDQSVDKWYNAVQVQINLAKYPQETAKILQRDIFWFFLKDGEFVSRTINDSNLDLDKFPASKVRQLAKKLESSKSTAKYIKQALNEPQATQVHLLKHQCTELPPNKHKKQRKSKPKPFQYRYQHEEKEIDRPPQEHEKYRPEWNKQGERCHKCGDTPHMEGSQCPASRHQCKHCSKIGHFSHLCFRKKVHTRKIQETQWHTNYKLEGTLQSIPWITKKIQMSVKVKTLSVYKCRLRNHKMIKKDVTHNT